MDLITPGFGLVFWQTVTLLVVLLVLRRFAWRPILSAINAREREVEEALRAIEQSKEVVAQVKAEKERMLRETYREREKLLGEAQAHKYALIEEAKAEASKVTRNAIEQTRLLVQEEREKVVTVLKNEVVSLSVQIAEKLLSSELQHRPAQTKLAQQLIREAQWD